jgi:hypothetical protein
LQIRHAAGKPLWTRDFALGLCPAERLTARRFCIGPATGTDPDCCVRDTRPKQNMPRSAQPLKLSDKCRVLNALVTEPVQRLPRGQFWVTTVKAAFLSFAMLAAIVVSGLGIYAADAANNHNAVDGYGVTASLR